MMFSSVLMINLIMIHFSQIQMISTYSLLHFDASTTDSFQNIVGKEEIARYKQFLPPQCFLNQIIVSPFVHIVDIFCF